MKKLISNEHSMNSKEIVALSMLKLYFTSVETEMRKQWKQRVMKCKNEEILIDGNSLLTLLESAKCYAVTVLEEKKEDAVVEKVLGYMMNVEFYDTVNNASDIFIKAIVDMFAALGDGHER